MLRITIDGCVVMVPKGSSVLEACKEIGINIPRFCYHDRLSVAGNCRMCLVEIEKSPKPVASCAMPVVANMVVFTDSPLVKKARENVLETLLLNHPLDCPICDQGGECDLQDQTRLFGGDYSRFYMLKRAVEDKYCGPLIKTIMTRCIHCTRCVRFATEIAGVDILGTLNRGQETEIGSYLERVFATEISGNVIDLCPVGALTSKPYAFSTRPWELRTVESIDFTDSVGSNIYVDFKESEVMRVIPRNNEVVNQDWISDKARFSYDAIKFNRINEIFFKKESRHSVVDWSEALDLIKSKVDGSNTLFLVSSNLDFESFCYLSKISKLKNVRVKSVDSVYSNYSSILTDSFFSDINVSDFCLLLGVNARTECSILNIRLRSQWQKGSYSFNCIGSPYKSTTPLNFLSLSSVFLLKIFLGNSIFHRVLCFSNLPVIILGESVKRRFDYRFLYSFFKKINPKLKLLSIDSGPNTSSLQFLNLKTAKVSDLAWSDTLVGVNLNDTVKVKNFFTDPNKFKIWMHSNGCNLASGADLILPISLPFEFEGVFLNSEKRPQRFYKVISSLKSSRSSLLFLKALHSLLYKSNNLLLPFKIIKLLENNFNHLQVSKIVFNRLFFDNYLVGKVLFTFIPFRSNLEDFYLSSSYLKSSRIMAKCSSSYRDCAINFN